ncbi:MAG: NUDIX domain-containing protein [Roseobacter sp.]
MPAHTTDKSAVRDAATLIVLRDRHSTPRILMGQRGAKAAFMPNKFVFPGGALDAGDAHVPTATPLPDPCATRLLNATDATVASGLPATAIRELWEETGLRLGKHGTWPAPVPDDWADFATTGVLPDAGALQFVFRALTPPGRPRRFDARFFLVDATAIQDDLDDFSAASDELSHLQWVPLEDARRFDMPFITEVVLAEVQSRLANTAPPDSVPYFRNDEEASLFLRLYGKPQADHNAGSGD